MDWLGIQKAITLISGGLFLLLLVSGIFAVDRVSKAISQWIALAASALLGLTGFCIVGQAVGGPEARLAVAVQLLLQLVVAVILFFGFKALWNTLIPGTADAYAAPRRAAEAPPLTSESAASAPAAPDPEQEELQPLPKPQESTAEAAATAATPDPAAAEPLRSHQPMASPHAPVLRSEPYRSPEVVQRCAELLAELREDHPELASLAEDFSRLMRHGQDDRPGESASIETILADLRSRPDMRALLDILQQDLASLKARETPMLDTIADRAREIAEVAFAVGEVWAAEAALDELLAINPKDLPTLNRKGHARALRGDLSGAAAAYRLLIQYSTEKHDDVYLAMGYGNLGGIQESQGDLDGAERLHQLSLELERKANNFEGLACDYGNLGKIKQARGDSEAAEALYRKALEIARQAESLEGEATQYANLGALYISLGDLEQAEMMLRHALIIEERLTNREGMADNYANLGLIYIARGLYDQAAESFHRALYLEDKLDRADRRGYAYANLGQIFLERQDPDAARRYWTQALNCFAQIPLPSRVEQVQSWLVELSVEA